MLVVEGRHQLDARRQQHAVAEHIARHVTDTDDGERLFLDVRAQLAEVAFHRLPGALGGDAHLLVVVALAAARREGIAQPEAVVVGQRIGDVGEGRRALVGGDHQIGVVVVAADDVGRRHDGAADPVVGDVEQPLHQRAVTRDAFGLHGFAVAAGGRPLDDEAALGADRHDHRVLDLLRLHQAQDFGAKVLAPVGPADAAARHLAAAQVNALHARRVDEDLDHRPRQRQVVQRPAVELEGDVGFRLAILGGLEIVGAQRRLDAVDEAPQDAVLVGADHRVELACDPLADRVGARLPVIAHRGIEEGEEQGDHVPRHLGIADQHLLHVGLGKGDAGLAQELGAGAQDHDLPAGEPGFEHQRVEVVALRLAIPEFEKGFVKRVADRCQVDGHAALRGEAEVVEIDGPFAVGSHRHRVRHFVQHLEAKVLQHRQHVGQHHRRARMVHLETHAVRLGIERPIDHRLHRADGQHRFDLGDVGDRHIGAERFLVAGGKGGGVEAMQIVGRLLAVRADQGLEQPVRPRPGDVDDRCLDVGRVVVGDLPGFRSNGQVEPGEGR